jgi:hypothetical protein
VMQRGPSSRQHVGVCMGLAVLDPMGRLTRAPVSAMYA